jgi:AraC family transcriptional regulator, regulatory protein of adaptative response / DNA-3-methyladenine glycosylase II
MRDDVQMATPVAPSSRPWLDHERCYRAVSSRDTRFDGWFVTAVRTTGIYCRPSCPAITPKRRHVEFLASAAAAQQRGYRACKRCRPDASPGSPDWDTRSDVVARAVRLIDDGTVDRVGVAGLAERLGYSSRHLSRLIAAELGAGPLALARAQRAQTARLLVETTSMALTDVAFAAGFSSVRQFNETFRDVFAASPSELRAVGSAAPGSARPDGQGISIRLPVRAPFAGSALFDFLAQRAVGGVEHWDGERYRRSLSLPHGHGVAVLTPHEGFVAADVRLRDWRDLAPAVQRVRRLLDLDADPEAVDGVLGADPVLASAVAAVPGRRLPGSVDPVETAVRAVIGQQVSVAGARTVAGRLVATCDRRLDVSDPVLTHVFPDIADIAALADADVPMPRSRRAALRHLAEAVTSGRLALDAGADRSETSRLLQEIPGIGGWTASYVLMRGLHDPDVFLPTDLGVRRALLRHGATVDAAEAWRPWRSYALHHLWADSPGPDRKAIA